jgi:lysophospholipase L1-like esterase
MLALLAAVAGLAACSSSSSSSPSSSSSSTQATYYVSLGDSLAVGVQPNRSGKSLSTNQGYADDLYNSLRPSRPGLQLVKLGCSGERTQTMINGGICRYRQGSQLRAAVAFLKAHEGAVTVVTLDLGTNNVETCVAAGPVNTPCVTSGDNVVKAQLPRILRQLRAAGGPLVRIIGMNMYDPYLSRALRGAGGQQDVDTSLVITAALNGTLAGIYGAAGDPMADVAGAFATNDTTPTRLAGHGTVPTNVARICQWTWMCAPKPLGPNIHPNATGYQMMAGSFSPLV